MNAVAKSVRLAQNIATTRAALSVLDCMSNPYPKKAVDAYELLRIVQSELIAEYNAIADEIEAKALPRLIPGDKVRIPAWSDDHVYTIIKITWIPPEEPIAFFEGGGFWRCSQLERATA